MNTLAVVPTCGASNETLLKLCKVLNDDGAETVLILNNMSPEAEFSLEASIAWYPRVRVMRWVDDFNIYAAWNWGIDEARSSGKDTVMILNDDIEIGRGSVKLVHDTLMAHPNHGAVGWDYTTARPTSDFRNGEYVSGTYRKGGIGGFAFGVRSDSLLIDERFTWWGGDDDLLNKIERRMGRRCMILRGLGVVHHTSTSTLARPEVLANVGNDRTLMLETWGESW